MDNRPTITEALRYHNIDADEVIIFLTDSIRESRSIQELKNNFLSPREQIQLELRITKMEYLLATLQNEKVSGD